MRAHAQGPHGSKAARLPGSGAINLDSRNGFSISAMDAASYLDVPHVPSFVRHGIQRDLTGGGARRQVVSREEAEAHRLRVWCVHRKVHTPAW